MRPTEQTLAEQLRITDREIARRRRLYDLTDEDLRDLSGAKPLVLREIDGIVEAFYEWVTTEDEMSRIIGDAETLTRIKATMRIYVLRLFDGQCDMEYVLSRLRIGMIHNRIGLAPRYFVSAVQRLTSLVRGVLLGAGEALAPADPAAVAAAAEKLISFDLTLVLETYINSLTGELRRRRRELREYASSLEETVKARTRELEKLARLDSLTGLANQRTLLDALRREVARSRRRELPMSVAFIDLDRFKEVNDTFGHRRGDEVLRALARTLRETLRAEDLPARHGGDEFVVVMPQTVAARAADVCRRITALFDHNKPPCDVTLSIGIAEFDAGSSADADMLIQFADDAMYAAKRQPGHAVVIGGREEAGEA